MTATTEAGDTMLGERTTNCSFGYHSLKITDAFMSNGFFLIARLNR